jgi:limonene-1,2-epoxide hydrolase
VERVEPLDCQGPRRHQAGLRDADGFATDFSFEFRQLAVVGDVVFTERVDRFVINDTPMAVPVAGVFEFESDGRISAWRDYYNWADLERQLREAGVDLSGTEVV